MGAPVLTLIHRLGRRGLPLVLVVGGLFALIALTSVAGRTAGNEVSEPPVEAAPAIEPPATPKRVAPREETGRPVEGSRGSARAASGLRGNDGTRTTRAAAEPARLPVRAAAAEPARTATAPVSPAESTTRPIASEKSAMGESMVGVGAKLFLGSLLLAGLLYGVARVVRRMPIARLLPSADGPIKVIGRTHLGPKASLALIQAEGATILIALTPNGVQALHTWNASGAGTGVAALDPPASKASRGTGAALPAQLRSLASRLTEDR